MDQHTLEVRDRILQSMMDNKKNLVKRYGSEAEKVMYGRAMESAKKQVEAERSNKLRETIRQCLTKPTQRLMEKKLIDKQGDEWENPYDEYNKDLTDYEPTQREVSAFERDEKGKSPIQPKKVLVPTGLYKLENRYTGTVAIGPKNLMFSKLNAKRAENPSRAKDYYVTPELK